MIKKCIVCNKEFKVQGSQLTCSNDCSKLLRKRIKICPICGVRFDGRVRKGQRKGQMNTKQIYCSSNCAHKGLLLRNNEHKKQRYANDEEYKNKVKEYYHKYVTSEHGKRVLQAHKLSRDERIQNSNEKDMDINLIDLFNRDNGVCWLCGEKCNYQDKELKISKNGRRYIATGPNYPSIDHVVPLSKGGLHTWENVRLAHKKCNIKKSNKILLTAT